MGKGTKRVKTWWRPNDDDYDDDDNMADYQTIIALSVMGFTFLPPWKVCGGEAGYNNNQGGVYRQPCQKLNYPIRNQKLPRVAFTLFLLFSFSVGGAEMML